MTDDKFPSLVEYLKAVRLADEEGIIDKRLKPPDKRLLDALKAYYYAVDLVNALEEVIDLINKRDK